MCCRNESKVFLVEHILQYAAHGGARKRGFVAADCLFSCLFPESGNVYNIPGVWMIFGLSDNTERIVYCIWHPECTVCTAYYTRIVNVQDYVCNIDIFGMEPRVTGFVGSPTDRTWEFGLMPMSDLNGTSSGILASLNPWII